MEVLTICKICYFLSLPFLKLQKSKWRCSAGSAFISVELSGSSRMWIKFTCRKQLFSWRLLQTFNMYFKNVAPPCEFCSPRAAKSWQRAWTMVSSQVRLPQIVTKTIANLVCRLHTAAFRDAGWDIAVSSNASIKSLVCAAFLLQILSYPHTRWVSAGWGK